VSRVVTTSSLARRITGSEPPAGEEHKNLHPIHSLNLGGGRRALVLHSRSASARGGDPAHSHTHRVSRLTIRLPYPPPRRPALAQWDEMDDAPHSDKSLGLGE
jgi:hypothetical protein